MDISGVTDGTVCCYDVLNSSFLSDVPIRKRYLSDLVNATHISNFALWRLCDFIFYRLLRSFIYFVQKKNIKNVNRLETAKKFILVITKYKIFNWKKKNKMSELAVDQSSFSFRNWYTTH